MDLRTFPPKLSSARTYADPGIGSLLAVAVAWDDLATGFRGIRLWVGDRDAELQAVPRSGSGLAPRGLDERDGLAT